MLFAAFFAQPHPKATLLRKHVLDLHPQRRADPRPVAQARRCRHVDAVQQRARSFRLQHRGPRTEEAGFTGTICPVTSQSNKCRTAARRSFAVGAACSRVCNSTQAVTCGGRTWAIDYMPASVHHTRESITARA